MLNLERALNQDRLLRALTGLNRKAFDALLPSFEQAYEASRIAAKPQRQRAIGGGRKARLASSQAKLFYTNLKSEQGRSNRIRDVTQTETVLQKLSATHAV